MLLVFIVIIAKFKKSCFKIFLVQNGCLLLKIGFMTSSYYFFLLKASPLGNHVMFYLTAAVSEFCIPDSVNWYVFIASSLLQVKQLLLSVRILITHCESNTHLKCV